jgi:zinc protease
MQNLREKKAYTYGARSNIANDKLIGNFNAFASVRNEVTDSSVTEFIYELERIVNEPVSVEDLNLSKSSLNGNFGRSLESPQTIANFALNTFRYNLPKDYYNNYLKNLDAVSVTDVQDMARKYIRPSNCNIIVVGNKDNVADKLKKFDSDGEVRFL